MKQKIIKFAALFLLILGIGQVKAQQDPMYTQYMFNTLSINPAYAGSRGVLNATGLVRAQWIGIKGAPITQTLSLHSPLPLSMGVGLSLVNDKIGPINNTLLYADYSYTVKVSTHGKLAFGLKAGFNIMQGDLTNIKTGGTNPDDAYSQNIKSPLKPNFGLGVYYYTDKWYAGISTPKIVENRLETGTKTMGAKEQRHYFIIAGMIVDINDYIKFKPSVLFKYTSGSPLGFDLSANFLFFDKLWLGLAHRWKESLSGIVRFQITDQLSAGYAYDFTLSRIRKYNSGSHEFMLSYDFIFNKKKVISPRYF